MLEYGVWPIALLVFIILLFSGFCSGAETAFTAASKAKIRTMVKGGNKRASLVERMLGRTEGLIGAILCINTFLNALATNLANQLFDAFGDIGPLLNTIVMTFGVLLLAEIMPKLYSVKQPERMALLASGFMNVLMSLLSPFIQFLTFISRSLWRFLGVNVDETGAAGGSMEELRGAIDLHHGPGNEVKEERAMLRSILDLSEMTVEDIMVHRKQVTMLDGNLSLEDAARGILDAPYTRLPVFKDHPDNIVGVLHAKELFRASQGSAQKGTVLDLCMTPWFVPETTSLHDQLMAFKHRREHFALVVDEYGTWLGIVTLEDILEEIVGEIADEHDESEISSEMVVQPDQSVIIMGPVSLRDINRRFDWHLPDTHAATIAGLILYESRQIPEEGQVFSFHGFRMEILKRHRNQIILVKLKKI